MPHVALPLSSPSAEGVAPSRVEAFLDALESTPGVEPHSLMILRHGAVVAAGWWRPYGPERLHLLYSLSKTFTATAVALAAGEGLLGLDDPVIGFFPELEGEVRDPLARSLRLRHLAAMASGHLADTWQQVVAADPEQPVRAFLRLPPEREPGTVFAYNQSATYTLATVVQRVAGTTVTEYLRPRLLDPLGVGEVRWSQLPPGQDQGFSGLHATTDSVARLGQCYLADGHFGGRALLPAGWVAEASSCQVQTARPGDAEAGLEPDWQQGYGFQLWRSRHGYRGDGAYGQFCLVLPEQEAVVAITGQSTRTQALLDAVWRELLPAFGEDPGRPDRAADGRLAERLAGLALAAPRTSSSPPCDPAPWLAATFEVAAEVGQLAPARVELVRAGDSWELVLEAEAGAQLAVPLGPDWAPARWEGGGAPVVAAGGWAADGALRAELLFVETPHRLVLACTGPGDRMEASWVTVPLGPVTLRGLGAPGSVAVHG